MCGLAISANHLMGTEPAIFGERRSWLAVQTRPRHEKKVDADLSEKGVQTFLPLLSEKRKWSDRECLVEIPLFSQYLFVRSAATAAARLAVLQTSGVTNFVGPRGLGTPIPDEEIERIQRIIERKIPFTPHPYLNVGSRVRIRGGALDGMEGILAAVNGDRTLVLSVQLLQRSLAVRISGFEIEVI
jgi:transcription antitermination factor NusG